MRADKSLSPFEIRLYRHYRVVHGIRISLAFLLTFLLVRLLDIPEGTASDHAGGDHGADFLWGNVVPELLSVLVARFWVRSLGWWRSGWSSFHCR